MSHNAYASNAYNHRKSISPCKLFEPLEFLWPPYSPENVRNGWDQMYLNLSVQMVFFGSWLVPLHRFVSSGYQYVIGMSLVYVTIMASMFGQIKLDDNTLDALADSIFFIIKVAVMWFRVLSVWLHAI